MSSSSEEDGDAAWKAAINSAAAGASSYINSLSAKQNQPPPQDSTHTKLPKHYQIKAQKLLDDIIEKSIEIVQIPNNGPDDEHVDNDEEVGVRLFKNAPPGIVFDHVEAQPPRKRPRILPGNDINEKSKKFKQQIRSAAVDANDILCEARDRSQRALSRLEAKEATAKEAAKREEERIAELKKVRGGKWLPSIVAAKREEEKAAQLKTGREPRWLPYSWLPRTANKRRFK